MLTLARTSALAAALTGLLVVLANQGSGPPAPQAPPEVFQQAVEYRTEEKNDWPISPATDNVMVYEVPRAGKRLRLKSYLLPVGIPVQGTEPIAPLGLGVLKTERTVLPMTVAVGTGYDLVTLEPGVVFEPGAKIVVRFHKTVKGLTGSLFLNGVLE